MSDLTTFRPRRGRIMAWAAAAVSLVVFGVGATFYDATTGGRFFLFLIGVAIAAFMWRYASLRVDVTAAGLRVRNLMVTRELGWDQIDDLHFVDGDPWPTLTLRDTEQVALMAIQRVDADLARQDAQRLAELIVTHQSGR